MQLVGAGVIDGAVVDRISIFSDTSGPAVSRIIDGSAAHGMERFHKERFPEFPGKDIALECKDVAGKAELIAYPDKPLCLLFLPDDFRSLPNVGAKRLFRQHAAVIETRHDLSVVQVNRGGDHSEIRLMLCIKLLRRIVNGDAAFLNLLIIRTVCGKHALSQSEHRLRRFFLRLKQELFQIVAAVAADPGEQNFYCFHGPPQIPFSSNTEARIRPASTFSAPVGQTWKQ